MVRVGKNQRIGESECRQAVVSPRYRGLHFDPDRYLRREAGTRATSSVNFTEIIEEAPAPGLSMELKKDLAEKAVAAAKAVN